MRPILVLAAMSLSACANTGEPLGEQAGGCNAALVQDLIGKAARTTQAAARSRSGAKSVRLYETGAAVTMEFRPDRLNIETDASGTIVRLTCG